MAAIAGTKENPSKLKTPPGTSQFGAFAIHLEGQQPRGWKTAAVPFGIWGSSPVSGLQSAPVPDWVKDAVDAWLAIAGSENGIIFRCVSKTGSVWGKCLSEKAVWWVVREYAKLAGIDHLAPHDLRRTCARLCHSAGG